MGVGLAYRDGKQFYDLALLPPLRDKGKKTGTYPSSEK
jgi:hypothetical protein